MAGWVHCVLGIMNWATDTDEAITRAEHLTGARSRSTPRTPTPTRSWPEWLSTAG